VTTPDPHWFDPSRPLAVDDDEPPADEPDERQPPNIPPPDFTPEETPEQGSQD
jgi:hypothetical protein